MKFSLWIWKLPDHRSDVGELLDATPYPIVQSNPTIITFTFSFKIIDTMLTNFSCLLQILNSIFTFRMEGQIIGPMFVNLTPVCYNSSLLSSTFPNLTELSMLHREVGTNTNAHKLKNARCALHYRNTLQELLGFICCSVKRNDKMRDILLKSLYIYVNT